MDVVELQVVIGFLGLTRDFWGENAKNSCKGKKLNKILHSIFA
jgi:hypothetical protein